MHSCNLSPWEVEAGEAGIQDLSRLHIEFEVIPHYLRPCFKIRKKRKEGKREGWREKGGGKRGGRKEGRERWSGGGKVGKRKGGREIFISYNPLCFKYLFLGMFSFDSGLCLQSHFPLFLEFSPWTNLNYEVLSICRG